MELLATGKSWAELTNRLPTFWQLLGMIVVVGILIWLTFRLKTWFRDDDDPAAAERQLLAGLHEMTEEGELSEDEYRLLKRRLGANVVRAQMGKTGSAAAARSQTLSPPPEVKAPVEPSPVQELPPGEQPGPAQQP